MKWVGRVLLIVLIASTLFVAKKSDLQTETAIAQQPSGPIRILTDDLTFSVVGSGIATATQAKINHQTEAVYVNGIKIQNTTANWQNFDLQVFFDLTFYLSSNDPNRADFIDIPLIGNASGTGRPGICGDGTRRLFGGTLQPYETRTIPTNLACADIAYYGDRAQFSAGSIPDGQNSASLNIVLRPNDNVILPSALIWPAAKITVTDLFPTSGGTHYMSLRLPDNSTRPSLSGTLFYSGGTTQSFGAALLGPPGTNYTINHSVIPNNQNPAFLSNLTVNDYAMYEQTVSVTKPNVQLSALPATITAGQSSTLRWTSSNTQTLTINKGIGDVSVPDGSRDVSPIETTTYTITARGQNGATATATATIQVTNDLPDLEPDLTDIRIEVTDRSGRIHTDMPSNFGSEIKQVVFKNLKVKNIGDTAIQQSGVDNTLFFTQQSNQYNGYPITVDINLLPGGTMILPTLKFNNDNSGRENYNYPLHMLMADAMESATIEDQAFLTLFLVVDDNETVEEKDEYNNSAETGEVLKFAAIRVSVSSGPGATPVALARIDFQEEDTEEVTSAVTEEDGYAWLAPTRSLYDSATYKIEGFLGGISFDSIPFPFLEVGQNIIYNISLTVNDLLVIRPILRDYDDPRAHPAVLPTGGIVEIKATKSSDDPQTLSAQIDDGVAVLSPRSSDLKPGAYTLKEARLTYSYVIDDGWGGQSEQTLSFKWPELTRGDKVGQDPNNPPIFSYNTGPVSYGDFESWVRKECLKVKPGDFDVCWEEDEEHIKLSKEKLLPIWIQEVQRFKEWKKFPAPEGSIFLNVVGANVPWMGRYEGYGSGIKLQNRYNLIFSTQTAKTTIQHEMFHLMDDVYLPGPNQLSDNPEYSSSINNQMASDVGRKLWDLAIYDCAYLPNRVWPFESRFCERGYSSRIDISIYEALAEEKATVCTYKQAVITRLDNIESFWEESIGPLSNADRQELLQQRDSVLSRLVSIDGNLNIIIPAFNAWHEQCLQ